MSKLNFWTKIWLLEYRMRGLFLPVKIVAVCANKKMKESLVETVLKLWCCLLDLKSAKQKRRSKHEIYSREVTLPFFSGVVLMHFLTWFSLVKAWSRVTWDEVSGGTAITASKVSTFPPKFNQCVPFKTCNSMTSPRTWIKSWVSTETKERKKWREAKKTGIFFGDCRRWWWSCRKSAEITKDILIPLFS